MPKALRRISQRLKSHGHSKDVYSEINLRSSSVSLNNCSPQIDVNEPNSKIHKLLGQASGSDGGINGTATTSGSEDTPQQNGSFSPTAEENHTDVSSVMTRAQNNRVLTRRSYSISIEPKTLKCKSTKPNRTSTTSVKNNQTCRKENSAVSSTGGKPPTMSTRTRRSQRHVMIPQTRPPSPSPPPSPPMQVTNGHTEEMAIKEEKTNESEDDQVTSNTDTHTDCAAASTVVVTAHQDEDEVKPSTVRTTASDEMKRSISETLKANKIHLQIDLRNNSNMMAAQNGITDPNERASTSAELKRPNADESCPLAPKKSFRGALSDTDQASDSEGRLRQRKESKSYQVGRQKCPTPGCDSKGHLYGKYERHYSVKTCPLHQNLTPERCRENKEAITRIKAEQAAAIMNCVEDLEKTIELSVMEDKQKQAAAEQEASSSKAKSSRKSKYHTVKEYNDLIKNYNVTPDDISIYDRSKDIAALKYREEMKKAGTKKGPGAKKPLKKVVFGRYMLSCWSLSKYVEEYCRTWMLYICEFCLKYMNSKNLLLRHMKKCSCQCPPGNEIYRKDNISIFEVDGAACKMYCQNLCLLAMLFIESKTVYLETEPFKFYVMTDRKATGNHMIGYFSKEKNSFLSHNLACILVLPHYLGGGYGRMLIDVSYHLSRREKSYGGPERPLSELGTKAYHGYWGSVIMQILSDKLNCDDDERSQQLTLEELSDTTGITPQDVIGTLSRLGMTKWDDNDRFLLNIKVHLIRTWEEKQRKITEKFATRKIDPSCFEWSPPPSQLVATSVDSSTVDVPSTSTSSLS